MKRKEHRMTGAPFLTHKCRVDCDRFCFEAPEFTRCPRTETAQGTARHLCISKCPVHFFRISSSFPISSSLIPPALKYSRASMARSFSFLPV